MKIGYQGVNGSFSQMAVNRYFAGREYEEKTYSDFNDMFIDVAEGKLDYGMFPVENTTTGIITRTYDLFQYYDLHAVGEVIVPVDQNLIGFPGAKIEEIRGVGCDMMIRKLLARNLIKEAGRLEVAGRPFTYEVTEQFMDTFKLKSLDELPELPEYQQVNETERELFE